MRQDKEARVKAEQINQDLAKICTSLRHRALALALERAKANKTSQESAQHNAKLLELLNATESQI
jgi:hypothetical protein